ncbi:Spermidine/putrescine-binding periplasmic protein [Rubellimicrobium thermophilum DSM 16684]|uniref:Spermidine/putrescine-binding periplasmic protein n=1 Tax=Rubellimicrobium thermophilum DSM 16684 TaxID=1123069 RepID=S9R1L7_9RHOB|nr:extracellular solute-binding protein [Rubellimicrobium thermophilum]EPX85787.1 Spermidine/putrescine-binding periplasmic protein [Rubellimicrobium thermophilum DSM 16684]
MKTATLLGAASLLSLATMAAAQDPELLVLDYPGFEDPKFHAPYVEAHGQSPTFSFFGDEEEAFQKVRSGFRADVAHICAGSVPKWQESGLIEPWDVSRLTYFEDLNASLMGQDVAAGGDLYFLPTDFGTTAIAYNPEQVPAEDVATLDVFRNPAYAGRMAIPDNVDDAWALAYLATGVTDWTEVTDEQFEAAAAWLREVHPNLRTYWTDPAELAQLLSTGEVLIAWAWNETYPTMKEEGRPIGFQREPAEGSSVWLCGMVNLVNGPGSEDKVYDYVNAFLSPQTTVPLVEAGWATANDTALHEQVTEEDLEASGLGTIEAPIFAQLPISVESRERHARVFEEIKAGF